MSSTKRGGVREVSDYYVTPIWAVKEFVDAFNAVEPLVFGSGVRVLDPCAGGTLGGAKMSYPTALYDYGVTEIDTLDIRDDSRAEVKGVSYLDSDIKTTFGHTPDVVISNPPFALALEFIQKGLRDVKSGGWVIMLCRLNFFGSQKRLPFFQSHMPQYAFVHSKRIPFGTVNGKLATDSIEYAHLCWKKDSYPKHTILHLVGSLKEVA